MPNMLADGLSWMAGQLSTNAAETISYARTGATTASISATYGRREYDVIDGNAITRFVSHDFIFKASLFDLGSGVVLPKVNDRITATIGSTSKTFQVLEVNGSCYTLDSFGVMLRVHTKEVG